MSKKHVNVHELESLQIEISSAVTAVVYLKLSPLNFEKQWLHFLVIFKTKCYRTKQ